MNKPCICHSGKVFQQCCDQFLNRGLQAKAPVQLMRSRYSAFALGGFGEYLMATWKRPSSDTNAAELSIKHSEWVGLEIVDKSQKGDVGFVEFKAYYLGEGGTKNVHHENSTFERIKGRWLYVSGDVR